uniref:Protein ALP1-like n=1 Tax=Tanacetum cinerariifolium TaxID=118510 RepID=A0A699I808_TANCI|nr:hypothetical protein [Tanacetum cinerariifolium]
MSIQEIGGSGSSPKKKRTYIPRKRDEAKQRLLDDYFGDDGTHPKYSEEYFRRCIRRLYGSCKYWSYYEVHIRHTSIGIRRVLRKRTSVDIEKIYALYEEKHGLSEIIRSIDCMHWDYRNCPKALHAQFKRRVHKCATLMLEVAADKKLWIWHAYFRVPRVNNDLNVLYGSPLFDDVRADKAPEVPFVVNGRTYNKVYYLADDIYPT